jgi:prolyl oligopeptidase
MRSIVIHTLFAGFLAAAGSAAIAQTEPDQFQWLEDVAGEKPLAFVNAQNQKTLDALQTKPEFASIEAKILAMLDDKARIPFAEKMGPYLYNFWRDAANPRGLWRRTTQAEYAKAQPAWETVLDIDALAKTENENWVFKGASCLPPLHQRCMVRLSRGGADAATQREFDTTRKHFVEGGFVLPEAKSEVDWRDADTLYVATDFGADSLTVSGYPRILKRWKRGTPLSEAAVVFEADKSDVAVGAWVDHTPGFFSEGYTRLITQRNTETHFLVDGKAVRLDVQPDAGITPYRQWFVIQLRSDWKPADKTYQQGSLLAINADAFMKGERNFDVLFEPTDSTSLAGYAPTKSALLLNLNDNVVSRVVELTPTSKGWQRRDMKLPGLGNASASGVDPHESDAVWVTYTDFLTPASLYLSSAGKNPAAALKSQPAYWDTKAIMTEQRFATSKDGTRVPYFVVRAKSAKLDGSNPTLLSAYGGFEVSRRPFYSGPLGVAWLERGGVFVLANIRGGGEFGPKWHQAALRDKRQNAFDDFIAVAEDLIANKVTSPKHLGIQGGSNGGLLVSTVMTQRPELFGAVVSQVPLTDMLRYHKLLAGASWVGEYGNPDEPADRAFLQAYSPYQKVSARAKYPRVLFTTSTRDDRVHPGHARKMFAKMQAQGHDVLYYENTEGGHAGAANNAQRAKMNALEYTFLLNTLK